MLIQNGGQNCVLLGKLLSLSRNPIFCVAYFVYSIAPCFESRNISTVTGIRLDVFKQNYYYGRQPQHEVIYVLRFTLLPAFKMKNGWTLPFTDWLNMVYLKFGILPQSLNSDQLGQQLMRQKKQLLIHFHIACIALTLVLLAIPVETAFTNSPGTVAVNSDIIVNPTGLTSQIPNNGSVGNTTSHVSSKGLTSQIPNNGSVGNMTTSHVPRKNAVMEKTVADDVPRDSPAALVIASSIAAVSILVFFVIAYLWHTHQLDSRARKLAIRLAADAETGLRSRSCGPQAARRYPKTFPKGKARGVSESSEDQNHYVILPPDEARVPSNEAGRNSLEASESDTGDNDDLFEQINLPPIGERGKCGVRVGRGAHRKWNRSRKSVSGASLDKRGSAITDKEVLSHFASRRHSTFFI